MPKMSTFLPAMWPAFFMRVSPASRKAKPACMNITRTAVMTTQIVDAAMSRSCLDTCLHLLEAGPCAVVLDVRDRAGPAEAVARLVAAVRGVHHRPDHVADDVIGDDEDELRLRQKARFEDPAPVLVRDAALAPVTDRLDHRHADVSGCLLDRVDHRLDALPDDDCLDLVHGYAATSSRTAPRASAGTFWIVWRIRPAIRYGSPSEVGRRSSRSPR